MYGLYWSTTLCLLWCLLLAPANPEKYHYQLKFLNVPLDHFNYVTNETFQIRYLINNTYSENRDDAPILFYTGNEGDIEVFAQNSGFIWEMAEDLGASIVFAEHRYYGQSQPPKGNSSDSAAYLGFLTAEQALADYAELLYQLTGGKNTRPVIAVGGSYGGMLAAWFRMKYPHLVKGALASSAPVLQFPDLTPCNVFSRIVSSVFSTAYTSNCSVNIKKSWDLFLNYSSSEAGREYLNKVFNFCTNMTKAQDIEDFLDYLEDVYGSLAMMNYPYETNFTAPLPGYPVRMFCGQLSKVYDGKELIAAMQKALNIYANYTGKSKCLDYRSAYGPSLDNDLWEFQSCTEMVMPMCSDGRNDMFREKKWDFKKYSDNCFKKFKVFPKEHEMIVRYGGKNIGSASNIIFSNGLLDPWSGGGVLRSPNNKIYIIIIPEGAHHIDLRGADPHDPISVREARKQELKIIRTWLYDLNFFV